MFATSTARQCAAEGLRGFAQIVQAHVYKTVHSHIYGIALLLQGWTPLQCALHEARLTEADLFGDEHYDVEEVRLQAAM